MSSVAAEDIEVITHIEFICNRVHDFGDELYEGMMDREYELVKNKAQETIKVLSTLIQSLTEEI